VAAGAPADQGRSQGDGEADVRLVTIAVTMGRDAKHLLIGSATRPEERKRLEEVIEGHPEIVAVTSS
jgi:hypothetical protein